MEDINKILDNHQNMYYGHGIGVYKKEKIESILKNGLRCKDNQLYFTSEELGKGRQISQTVQNKLDNWPHLESKQIIIISLPIKYHIVDSAITYGKRTAAYHYKPDIYQLKKENLKEGNYIMPEFIFGYYDTTDKKIYKNDKYYELLSEKEQQELFNLVENNYIKILQETIGVEEYKQLCKEIGIDNPLIDKKTKNNNKEKEVMLNKNQEVLNKLFESQVKFPDGKSISGMQYYEKTIKPNITEDGKIALENGVLIPVNQYITEKLELEQKKINLSGAQIDFDDSSFPIALGITYLGEEQYIGMYKRSLEEDTLIITKTDDNYRVRKILKDMYSDGSFTLFASQEPMETTQNMIESIEELREISQRTNQPISELGSPISITEEDLSKCWSVQCIENSSFEKLIKLKNAYSGSNLRDAIRMENMEKQIAFLQENTNKSEKGNFR